MEHDMVLMQSGLKSRESVCIQH